MDLSYAIHGNHVSTLQAHPWEPHTSMPMGTSHHYYLAPLAIFLCWAFFFFFFLSSLGSLCVGRLGFLYPCLVWTTNTSPPSPHTTMSSDTTCWGDKHLGELPWVINITYRDTSGYVLNYVILTTYSFHLYSMWDFTHMCNPTISPSRVSLCLSVGFKTSLWATNKFYSLPLV